MTAAPARFNFDLDLGRREERNSLVTESAMAELLAAAGPGRMRLRVDIQMHCIARLAPGRARGELSAIGHHNLDGVIFRMRVGLHKVAPARRYRALFRSVSLELRAV